MFKKILTVADCVKGKLRQMAQIFLIRHGENEYVKTGRLAGRLPGVHLNDVGQKQANELAAALEEFPIKTLYSSPMERARETAQPISMARGLELQIHQGLVETNLGEWAGQELKNLRKLPLWKDVQGRPSRFCFPGGESFIECQTRMVTALMAIGQSHADDEIIACVSHADPIKLAIAFFLGMPIDFFQRLACDTASLTIINLSSKGVLLIKSNQTPPFKFSISEKK